jgi:adenylate cyclase class 2
MAIEIEKKYILDKKRLVEIARKLTDLGASFAYESFEENYLHKGGVLDEKASLLRLRKTDAKATLTYKEKTTYEGDFKHQTEFETIVSDVDAMENIIEKLGYTLSIVYEKHRKTWHFGPVEVVLDELPFGYFMEIEGEMTDITDAEELLDVGDLVVEPRGYPSMTVKFGKLTKRGVYESRFAKKSS